MIAPPFSRMLWKEYRSLRMLWIGCALGTLGLWLLLYVVTALSYETPRQPVELMGAFWSLALWLPAIYLLGCTVATFAGEKEERTADWLIHTAAPFRSTFAAKVIWPVLSAAAMQLLLFGATVGIREYFLAVNPQSPLPADEMLTEFLPIAVFALLEALVWGLFWSLQLSKPMPAAVLAAICIVLLNAGTINYHTGGVWGYAAPWSVLRTFGVVVLFLVDVRLARRWVAGRGVEWSIPWHRFIVHRQTPLALPAVESASPWRRAWLRFRWLEWQSVRLFLIFSFLLAIVVAIPMFVWLNDDRGSAVPLAVAVFILPLFAGLAAWQGEQSRFQFRFLVNRGVSPFGLWLNKFVFWLATLMASAVLIVTVAFLARELGLAIRLKDGDIGRRIQETIRFLSFPAGRSSIILGICGYLTWFVSAFTVSLYFRRAIFAFGAGLILQIALFIWFSATSPLNLSVWFGVLPIAAWLLWCGVRHLPRWSLERTGWPWNAMIAADWLIFPILFAAAVTSYWVYSVPLPDVQRLLATAPRPLSAASGPQEDAAWTDVLQKAYQVATRREELLRPLEIEVASDNIPAEQWALLEGDVKALRDALLKPAGISTTTTLYYAQVSPDSAVGMSPLEIALSLMQLAGQELSAGRMDDSIRSLRAAVRFVGAVNADAPIGVRGSDSHQKLHEAMQRWAHDPAATPEIIQQALAELERHELRWWQTDPIRLESLYQLKMKEIDRVETSLGFRRWFLKPAFTRQRRINACELSNQLRYLRSPPASRGFSTLVMGTGQQDADPAWSWRSAPADPSHQMVHGRVVPIGLTADVIAALWDRETRIRCTFAVMALEAFRKKHGHLPNDLGQVVPQFASRELLTDPWSGALLQFQPEVLPGDLVIDLGAFPSWMGRTLTVEAPFVWSGGPGAYQIRITQEQSVRGSKTIVYRFQPSNFVDQGALSAYVYSIPPDERPADALKPDREPAGMMPNGGGVGDL